MTTFLYLRYRKFAVYSLVAKELVAISRRELGGNTMNLIKSLEFFGDTLEIRWDGSCWVSPSTGCQHSSAWDAMYTECTKYLQASGETAQDIRAMIARHLPRDFF